MKDVKNILKDLSERPDVLGAALVSDTSVLVSTLPKKVSKNVHKNVKSILDVSSQIADGFNLGDFHRTIISSTEGRIVVHKREDTKIIALAKTDADLDIIHEEIERITRKIK